MDDNNRKNLQEEINERLDSNEENINNLVKKNNLIEKQLAKIAEIKIPDYSQAIETLTQHVQQIGQNEESRQLLPLLKTINERLDKVPKSAVRQLRILLFPEINSEGYYKIVFGRLIPWAFGFMLATYIFISSSKALEIYRYNKDVSELIHCGRAWLYLKQHGKKKVLSAMDQAYEKTGEK